MVIKKVHALCTLFDSRYLDKGIVLYQSLRKVSDNFTLYVLAMDDKCFNIIEDLHYNHFVPIRLSDFENEDLLIAKENRPFGEYCWTCSSSLIKYIIDTFNPDYCSYIDADMAFYSDPYALIEELEENKSSVSIIGHRFGWYAKKSEKKLGRYCVECNTFKNDSKAKSLLNIWINQCLQDCSQKDDGTQWGDQKYMDNWVEDYDYVIESFNLGAGIAPWNIPQYSLESVCFDGSILVRCKGRTYKTLFYHFEGITYKSKALVDIHIYSRWGIDDKLVKNFYEPYLSALNNVKKMLDAEYGLYYLINTHPALKKQSKFQIVFKKIKYIASAGFVNLFFHILPRSLFYNKNFFPIDNEE